MAIWQSYRNLSPRARILLGCGVMGYATLGLFLSDRAEQYFGFTPTEQDKERLREAVPKLHTVDRER